MIENTDSTQEIESDLFSVQREKIKEIKKVLREAGFPRMSARFPCAMHHNFYRLKIRICGKKTRHKDIRRILSMWMRTRKNEDDLLWQFISGAIKDMIKKEPGLVVRLPLEIRRGMNTVDDGYDFLRYAKALEFELLGTENGEPEKARQSA